jgi:hypothetical protein
MIVKIKHFLRKYWIFVLLAAVTSGLLLIRLIQKGQVSLPENQPTPSPEIALTLPKISGTTIPPNSKTAFIDFSFPSRLKTYQGQEIKLTADKAKRIAQELNFSDSPQINEDVFLGTIHTWSDNNYYLTIALDSSKIEYNLDLFEVQLPTKGTLPSPETARTNLENLLAKLGLTPNVELKWQKEKYLSEGYYLQLAQPEQADFIEIGANPAIGQYQLIGLDPNEPLISIVLGKNGKIVRFRYQIFFSEFVGGEIQDLKTQEGVENSLLLEGKIVSARSLSKPVIELKISQAEFNQITLAYYQDPEKNPIIQPIYILSGQGTLENGETTEIIAYLPAIKFGTQTPQNQNQEVPREFFQIPELP